MHIPAAALCGAARGVRGLGGHHSSPSPAVEGRDLGSVALRASTWPRWLCLSAATAALLCVLCCPSSAAVCPSLPVSWALLAPVVLVNSALSRPSMTHCPGHTPWCGRTSAAAGVHGVELGRGLPVWPEAGPPPGWEAGPRHCHLQTCICQVPTVPGGISANCVFWKVQRFPGLSCDLQMRPCCGLGQKPPGPQLFLVPC